MSSGVITVGRKQYASGLYWENSPTGRVSQAAREAARQPGNQSEYYVVRMGDKQGRVPQFGLAPRAPGFRPGIPSLAGCLANQQPGSWIGAFRLREGTALVVVRDDLIVPDGDVFFADEIEARDRLFQEMAVGGFQRIYAPESWGVPGADTMPLGLLLNERADVRLRTVSLSTQMKVGIVLGISFLFLLLGFGLYIQEQNRAAEEQRLREMEALRRMQEQAMQMMPVSKGPEYPPPERKWESRPRAMEVIKACQDSLVKVSVRVAGWTLAGIMCDESSLQVRWTRSSGFANPPSGAGVSDTGQEATTVVPHQGLTPRGPEDLWDPEVITKRYLNQNWTGAIARAPDDPPPPPPPGYEGEWNPPPPPWVKRSFTVTVPVLPWTLPLFFSEVPGVVVTSLIRGGMGSMGETWTVDGEIYENRR